MLIKTRDFGEIEVSEESIFHFTQPIFGFEEYTKYAILQDVEIGGHIAWLQSLQNPELCFILIDPSGLSDIFNPVLPQGAVRMLGEGDCFCWVIAVITENLSESTVNLKSPIFMNAETRLAAQIMLDEDYPVR
ncbi:MAG: flagellar assembly protein FliW, partial [Clostridiales bacterium]|nr:flagellar assembly protein FliW [Clostridiales bacterium]